jgi:hypothetical protein
LRWTAMNCFRRLLRAGKQPGHGVTPGPITPPGRNGLPPQSGPITTLIFGKLSTPSGGLLDSLHYGARRCCYSGLLRRSGSGSEGVIGPMERSSWAGWESTAPVRPGRPKKFQRKPGERPDADGLMWLRLLQPASIKREQGNRRIKPYPSQKTMNNFH